MAPEMTRTNIPPDMRLERRPTCSTRVDERTVLRDENDRVLAEIECWVPEYGTFDGTN
jgi:hypothetical protein